MTTFNSIKKLRALLLAVAVLLCVAAPAQAFGPDLFNVEDFTAGILDEAGHDYTLAGGHPFEAVASFSFPVPEGGSLPLEDLKSAFTELPPGFVGNVAAAQRCPLDDLLIPSFGPPPVRPGVRSESSPSPSAEDPTPCLSSACNPHPAIRPSSRSSTYRPS